MNKNMERRQTVRTPLYTRGVAGLNEQLVSIKVRDYSPRGVRLELPAEHSPEVTSTFKLYLLNPGLGAKGSVRWVRTHEDTAIIGVRFEYVDYSTRILEEL